MEKCWRGFRTLAIFTFLSVSYTRALYEENSPHIIVFLVDDLGWDDVGFHGSDQIPTPNIDALGYNGIILNRHYVLPSSTPSRSAFFTGLYPIRMGMQGESINGGEPRGLPTNIKILPEHLRGLGYATKLIGKWHIGYHTPQHTPLHRGFDSFLGFYNSHVTYYDYKYSYQNMSGYDMHRGEEPAYGLPQEYATDLFTDEAIRIIEHHELPRPLYLQISHLAVHAPVTGPNDQYDDRAFDHIPEPNRRKYAKMVSRLDNSVGRVVHALGEQAMLKDSLILFLTDNGAAINGRYRNWGSNYPLRGAKYSLYEGGVRGVGVIWSPRIQKAARVSNQLIHMVDWLPTLYSAARGNLSDLGTIDGVDQWELLSEGYGRGREKLLLNIDEVRRTEAAIYNRFKLIKGATGHGLFDGHYNYYGDNERRIIANYTENVIKSAVSQSITYHLGGPVTQPSTIVQLRRDATVECRPNGSPNYLRNSHTTCNATNCLFDIINDPCERNNIVEQYHRVAKELNDYLEKYGRALRPQMLSQIDYHADPGRNNDTWEPWMNSAEGCYNFCYSSAVSVGNLVFLLHAILISTAIITRAFL